MFFDIELKMQLAKEERFKMKDVIFTVVFIASLFANACAEAVCANSECTCIDNLKTLNCSHTYYSAWPVDAVECCPDYKSIELSYNNFAKYPTTESKDYMFVNISNNILKTFRPPSVLETKILDVSSNVIDSMSLNSCYKLEELYAANNSLNENNFESGTCNKLVVLDLSLNRFKGLGSITHCKILLALDMSNNNITSIPLDFQSLNSLKNVSFFGNELESLNRLPGSIVRLNISKNKLTDINNTYFTGLEALEILDLSKNSINTLDDNAFAELTALEMLDLSDNKLTTLPRLDLCENVRNVILMRNKITDMNATVIMHLLNSTDREVDVRDNRIRVVSKRQFVLYLDNSGARVVWFKNCTCFDVSSGNATLKFCAKEEGEKDECWVDIARMSSPSTISTTTTSSEISSVARITEGNTSRAQDVNETAAAAAAAADAGAAGDGILQQAAFLGLSGSKLSFLGFLLLTFVALLVANCVAGDPVVDERWWEETLRGDRVIS